MLEISMEKRYLENLGADGMTVMKRVTKKKRQRVWTKQI